MYKVFLLSITDPSKIHIKNLILIDVNQTCTFHLNLIQYHVKANTLK